MSGAEFLAARRTALLADEPRVGKTGASILACDIADARSVLVITTATNRYNFARDFEEWQTVGRSVAVAAGGAFPRTDVVIVPWSLVARAGVLNAIGARRWDVLIIDEAHYAKNHETQRTRAVFSEIAVFADRTWLLTGTPVPNAPIDLWPALCALDRGRLHENAARGWPDVLTHRRFRDRYCIVVPRFGQGGRRVEVIIGGRNEDELRARLDGWWLRRTQADVGIQPPRYETLLLPPASISREALSDVDQAKVLEAAEADDTRSLEHHLGTLRRLTGGIKASAVADAVAEEFACGLDCIVLMCWHQDTVAALAHRLSAHGVVTLTGASTPAERERAQHDFQQGRANVFIGQILAAGEAIDLSRSAELVFVEPSYVPKDMSQAALRITNHTQKRTPRVRVAALQGSIDEAVSKILVRKVQSISKVLGRREAA